MSELRYDPLGGFWVNIASIRAERPNEFRRVETRRPDAICPFCAGHESRTPPSLLELRPSCKLHSDHPGRQRPAEPWTVRVVPNKYPAFSPEASRGKSSAGPYASFVGGGLHEIVVESPRHIASLAELSDDELLLAFQAYQSRIQAALKLDEIRQVTLFKNCRSEAGASIEHVHSQLIASPIIPDSLSARFERAAQAYLATGLPLLQSMVQFEQHERRRIVESRGRFVAFCPYASRFAFQLWIAAARGGGAFEQLAPDDISNLARLVRSSAERLERVLEHPPYNLLLHLPPKMSAEIPSQEMFPWFIEIIPRLGRLAGFELAGGGWITDWLPENAAAKLRGETI